MPEHAEHESNPGESILEGAHVGDSAFALAEGFGGMHALEAATEGTRAAGLVEGASPFMAGFGGVLGAFNMGKGAAEMMNAHDEGDMAGSEGSQGALDMVSGGLGVASTAAFLATGAVCPPLAVAAGLAGLGSFGNEYAEDNGWYGQHQNAETGETENATFLNSIGDSAGAGWNMGHDIAGDGIAGDVLGGVAGGLAGAGQTVWNAGAAIGGGVARAGSAIGNAAGAVWSYLSDERFKRDVAPITSALDLLDRI
jgi:hypothetical protein